MMSYEPPPFSSLLNSIEGGGLLLTVSLKRHMRRLLK